MSILAFGHRLGLLKEAWGFSLGKELASAMNVDESTVYRWINKSSGQPRDQVVADLIERLTVFFFQIGLLAKFNIDESLFRGAMKGSDLEFVNFLASASSAKAPIPNALKALAANPSQLPRTPLQGRFVMYRLGTSASRKAGLIFSDSVKHVLRRIPVEFHHDGHFCQVHAEYYGSSSRGFAFFSKSIVTIIGEDTDQSEFDLFFVQLYLENRKDPIVRGVLSGASDLGAPTAYKVILREASYHFQHISWKTFCENAEAEIELEKNGTRVHGIDEFSGMHFQKYLDELMISERSIDLMLDDTFTARTGNRR